MFFFITAKIRIGYSISIQETGGIKQLLFLRLKAMHLINVTNILLLHVTRTAQQAVKDEAKLFTAFVIQA